MKNPDKVKMGKKSRAQGAAFELRVRKDLEEKGWIVDKWSNNVEFNTDFTNALDLSEENYSDGKLVPAKRKYLGPGRPMVIGTGFPDFLCFKWTGEDRPYDLYDVNGVECKTNGYLDKDERNKCRWLLDNNIFSKILIAEKTKEGRRIIIKYHDFEEKYGKI